MLISTADTNMRYREAYCQQRADSLYQGDGQSNIMIKGERLMLTWVKALEDFQTGFAVDDFMDSMEGPAKNRLDTLMKGHS